MSRGLFEVLKYGGRYNVQVPISLGLYYRPSTAREVSQSHVKQEFIGPSKYFPVNKQRKQKTNKIVHSYLEADISTKTHNDDFISSWFQGTKYRDGYDVPERRRQSTETPRRDGAKKQRKKTPNMTSNCKVQLNSAAWKILS